MTLAAGISPRKRSLGVAVHCRGTLVCAAVIAAAIGASVVRASPSAPPLVQVTPHELRLSQPLVGLAAEGRRAAFAHADRQAALAHRVATQRPQLTVTYREKAHERQTRRPITRRTR